MATQWLNPRIGSTLDRRVKSHVNDQESIYPHPTLSMSCPVSLTSVQGPTPCFQPRGCPKPISIMAFSQPLCSRSV
ncbi:hypothetical protein CEXT_377931 [Caerostris extrusa]|uniref:Uncharacterized protein n=1 Tax=Caerostris extrusa TaxID=172846 RepID=A0AAV4WX02_CAEEX|nr:hypothetical protein CEXT_377931 [Caerostris extrusa]